jgi:8-amino-7-oxononanoate synthase
MGVEAVRWIQGAEAEGRRKRLRGNVERLAKGVPGLFSEPQSAILPVPIGGEEAALRAAEQLLEEGFWVPAIRYPTVARGAARLRVALSAVHSEGMVDALGCSLARWKREGFGA